MAGTPERIRTSDLLLRRQTLYPSELQAHAPRLGAPRIPNGAPRRKSRNASGASAGKLADRLLGGDRLGRTFLEVLVHDALVKEGGGVREDRLRQAVTHAVGVLRDSAEGLFDSQSRVGAEMLDEREHVPAIATLVEERLGPCRGGHLSEELGPTSTNRARS